MREFIQNNQGMNKAKPPDPRLVNYVAQCRKMRIAEEEIRNKLLKAGYPESEADRVLGKDKNETTSPFLGSGSKPAFAENTKINEPSREIVEEKFSGRKSDSRFFSKKTIFIIIVSALLILGFFIAGYYFIYNKNYLIFGNKGSKNNSKDVSETDCGSKKFNKPAKTGSAVLRVDSTMKLLADAINEGNYCMTMSLFSDDSKDKHKDLIKKVLENESKRIKFAQDLKDYMIPPIDENDPSAQAKGTVTSSKSGTKQFYSIVFSRQKTGEYLISSI